MGGTFGNLKLNDSQMEFLFKQLSSDAFSAIIIDRLQKKVPTSAVRTSDGERSIVIAAKTGRKAPHLINGEWLNRYGMEGITDWNEISDEIVYAGNNADFLACSISGVALPWYRTDDLFNKRDRYIDQFFPMLWLKTGRIEDVLCSSPSGVIVCHYDANNMACRLQAKFRANCTGIVLTHRNEQKSVEEAIVKMPQQLVLVAGGASSKGWMVRLAKNTGKCVLDIGQALQDQWAI